MKTLYPIPATLRFSGLLPAKTQVNGRHVTGKLATKPANVGLWRDPPHKAFANLPRFDLVSAGAVALLDDTEGRLPRRDAAGGLLPELIDLRALEGFIKKYGVLRADIEEATGGFDEDAANYTDAQDTLRNAWSGDTRAVMEVESQVKYALEALPSVRSRSIELTTQSLWSLICILFLMDHAAGRTGVCTNPECPARYFLRKRKDQKYCERGPCSAHAQRQYALGWWKRRGYAQRAKRSKEQTDTKKGSSKP